MKNVISRVLIIEGRVASGLRHSWKVKEGLGSKATSCLSGLGTQTCYKTPGDLQIKIVKTQ